MGLVLYLLLLPVCSIVAIVRWRRRRNASVPLVLLAVNLPFAVYPIVAVVRLFGAVEHVNQADQSTILAAGIAEMLDQTAWLAVGQLVVAAIAIFVDRAILRATTVSRPGT